MMINQFGLPVEAFEQVLVCLKQYRQIKSAVIYGSRAKGTYRPGSDVDICLDAPDLCFADLLALENQIDDLLLPWQFDICLKHQLDNPDLLAHIERVGQLIYPDA